MNLQLIEPMNVYKDELEENTLIIYAITDQNKAVKQNSNRLQPEFEVCFKNTWRKSR